MALYKDIPFGSIVPNGEKENCINCNNSNEDDFILFWSVENNYKNIVICKNCISVVKGLYSDLVEYLKKEYLEKEYSEKEYLEMRVKMLEDLVFVYKKENGILRGKVALSETQDIP